MHDIHQVVALREHFVNFLAAIIELASKRSPDCILYDFGMGLVTDSEHILSRDNIVETRCCGLQVV